MNHPFECETCGSPISSYVEARFAARIYLDLTDEQDMPDNLKLIVRLHEDSPTLTDAKLLLRCDKCISVQARPNVKIIKEGSFHKEFKPGKTVAKAIIEDLLVVSGDVIAFAESTIDSWSHIKPTTQLVNSLQELIRRSDIKDELEADS